MSSLGAPLLKRIDRHTAVAGLLWRPLAGLEESEPGTEVKIEAKLQGARYGVLQERPGGRLQVALLPNAAPSTARSGYSAAVWLSAAVTGPTLYIEHLGKDRFWVLAVSPGVVDARTDVVLSEEEAEERIDGQLQEMQGLELQADIFIKGDREPHSNMLPRFKRVRRSFEELIATTPPPDDAKLDQLVGIKPRTYLAAFGVLVAAGIGYMAFLGYEAAQQQREVEAEQRRLISEQIANEQMRTLAELRIAEAIHMAITEDTTNPKPSDVIALCLTVANKLQASYAGWKVDKLGCDATGSSAIANLQQGGLAASLTGTNADLLERARQDRYNANVEIGASVGTIAIPLPGAPLRTPMTVPQLPKRATVLERVGTRLQLATAYGPEDLSVQMSPPVTRPITYINPAKEDVIGDPERILTVPEERGYRTGTLTVRGTNTWLLNALDLDYPFVHLTDVTFTPTATGVDYHLEATYVIAAD